jgi:D-alanyl-lipoteichoic acid acyltransferase DltB (MBOAT superfamily)
MSYTIDIFRRRIEPTRNLLEYTTFVALFPYLIAGPIVRFTDLGPQLKRLTPRLTSDAAARGAFFLSSGLVKKLLIADQLSPYVNNLYSRHAHLGLLTGWAAAVGYSRSCTSTSPAIRIWPSGSPGCSASASRRTSTRRSRPSTSPTSGAAGT